MQLLKRITVLLAVIVAGVAPLAVQAQTGGTQVLVPGLLKFEAYSGIPGTPVQGLLDSTKYPNSPSETWYMTALDTRTVYPNDSHENYGARISGFITPTVSGDYEFFLRSDDASQLFLSPDDNRANLAPVAEETGCCGAFEETGAAETSLPVNLQAGRRYALEVLYKEGGGGDYAQVAWRRAGDTTPAAELLPIPGAFLSTLIPASGAITITQQPTNVTAAQNDLVTFSVAVTVTNGPLVVQWQKNGVSVPGLTGSSVVIGPLTAADNGAKIRAILSIPGATTNSAEATLTVTADVTPPRIRSVVGSDTFDAVTVDFSEAVTAASAGATANYSLDGGLTISGVTVVTPSRVRLATSRQAVGSNYVLTVRNIIDTAGNAIVADARQSFTSYGPVRGGLKFEAYLNIPGVAMQGMLDDPKYPNSPDIVGYVTQFTSRDVFPDASHENYGGRISGWIVPAETAQYEFFVRSDDPGQIFLSPDDNPANAVMIAEETGCCGPFEETGAAETSPPQALVANRRYYIYGLWKEGGGGDYLDVAWRKVGDTNAARGLPYIQGAVLETLALPGTLTRPTSQIVSPAAGAVVDTGVPVTLTATATAAGGKTITLVEFFETGRKLGEARVAPYSLTLFGLSADSHTFVARATDSVGLSTDSAPVSISIGVQVEKVTLVGLDDKSTWRYDRGGQDLGTEWREKAYNDSAWREGKALIADEGTTTVEPIRTQISRFNDAGEYVKTFYFRTHFNFNSAVSAGVKLQLRHVIDDGAIFYLNGVEINRLGIAADPVDFQSDAAGHENIWEGPFDISITNLVQGDNVLSAEVHQAGGSSSDVVFGAELVASVPILPVVATVVGLDDKSTWRYDRSGQDLGTEWREKAYNDSAWREGKALIADEGTTTVEPIRTQISRFNDAGEYVKTFYFRTHFAFPTTNLAGAKLRLRHVVDDGVVFYLNGVEIHRLGIAADPVDFQSDAAGHENIWEGPFDIGVTNLVAGDNVLAAEVHQAGGSSSDVVFGAELVATYLSSGSLVPPDSALRFTRVSRAVGNVVLEWSGTGTLEVADAVTGGWTPIPAAASPHSVAVSGSGKFYRLKR